MVSLLLDYGAEVNAKNEKGRTALMEASLWRRLENAEILLSRGADRYLYDKKNKRALDLAQPTRANHKERHMVVGGVWNDPSREPIYKEDSFSRNTDRAEIARILRGVERTQVDGETQVPKRPISRLEGLSMISQSIFMDGFDSTPYPALAKQLPSWKGEAFSIYSGDEWLGPFGMAFDQR